MKQVKLSNKYDLAFDGNEVWTIDYSDLYNPKPGPHHIFNFGEISPDIKVDVVSSTGAVISFKAPDGNFFRFASAHIRDDTITFTDSKATS